MRQFVKILGIAAVIAASSSCFAQNTDTIASYANFCYQQLGIKAGDLPVTFDCSKGTKLTTFVNGKPATFPHATPNHVDECDAPAWLPSNAVKSQCYDATYTQLIEIGGNKDFKGVLNCRHKKSNLTTDTDFDDVAMIFNNNATGKTCWFQTSDTGAAKSKIVPRPDKDTTGYWLKPSKTSAVGCARCHDNGSWVYSQWLYDQFHEVLNGIAKTYTTPSYTVAGVGGAPPAKVFSNWPDVQSNWVTVGKFGIPANGAPACTGCHNLAGKVTDWPGGISFSSSYGTYPRWLPFVTGQKAIPQATTTTGQTYDYTHWMPLNDWGDRPAEANYGKDYDKYLASLKSCMELDVGERKDPTKPCAVRNAGLNPAPGGNGAAVTANATMPCPNNTIPLPITVQTTQTELSPTPICVEAGTDLTLSWQADATFYACTTELTLPSGVTLSSPGGLLGTGSNWTLADTPPSFIGPLAVPGIYDISMYCDRENVATIQFQILGQSPPYLQLSTATDDTVRNIAFYSVSGQTLSTTTNVLIDSSAELIWVADNVQASTCSLTGPGISLTGDSGDTAVALTNLVDETFTLSCTGDDGNLYSVASTLNPVTSNACNVQGGGGLHLPAVGKCGSNPTTGFGSPSP